MAFKPALAELCKNHSVCTKIRLFKIQNWKNFLGRGHSPLSRQRPLHPSRRCLRHLDPRAFGARTRHSQSSFSRKRSLLCAVQGESTGREVTMLVW